MQRNRSERNGEKSIVEEEDFCQLYFISGETIKGLWVMVRTQYKKANKKSKSICVLQEQ